MTPPDHIDGARVLAWAWSDQPFGHVTDDAGAAAIAIHGLALCRYADEARVYRFSCDAHWECRQDQVHDTLDSARDGLPGRSVRPAAAGGVAAAALAPPARWRRRACRPGLASNGGKWIWLARNQLLDIDCSVAPRMRWTDSTGKKNAGGGVPPQKPPLYGEI